MRVGERVQLTDDSGRITTITLATLIAVPLGTLAAYRQGSWLDRGVMAFSVLSFSVPVFVTGYCLIWLLSVIGSGHLIYYWPAWPMLATAIPVILGWINGGARGQRRDERRALPPSGADDLR